MNYDFYNTLESTVRCLRGVGFNIGCGLQRTSIKLRVIQLFLLSFLNLKKQHTKLFDFGESFGLRPHFIFYFLFSLFCLSFLYTTVTEQYPVENIVAVTDQVTSNWRELKKSFFVFKCPKTIPFLG